MKQPGDSGPKATLKIFLGAAPGVGKTYNMLRYAQSLKMQGVDVVVGYLEAHQRAETVAQLGSLEVIEPAITEFQGGRFAGVDIDAILRRHPQVVVIDELAHANVPGSRNAKRFMDVEALLDAGIDVLTSVNVQHLAKVQQEAERITGHPVGEIVPQSIIDRGELEMVDVTPEALRRRLRDGGVYPADQVETALRHFFRRDRLSGLRELALREVAQNVERRLEQSHEREKIPGAVGARENVLVCVNLVFRAESLVAKAARMSARRKTDLILLAVTNPSEKTWGDSVSPQATKKWQMFQELADRYHGQFVLEDRRDRPLGQVILETAARYNVTQIVVGQPRAGKPWSFLRRDKPIRYLLQHLDNVDLRIVGWRE